MTRKTIKYILALLCLTFSLVSYAVTPTATSLLDRAAGSLLKAGSLTAKYTIRGGGHSQSGTLNVHGRQFSVLTGSLSSWYDGRTLWTYDASEGEVTVSSPTPGELASMNPYAMLSSYKNEYTARLVKSKVKGTYAIQLSPRNASNPVRSALLTLRASDLQPVRLDVTARGGGSSAIVVTNIRKGVKLPNTTFQFPKSKYPKARVIDLR